MTHLCVEDWLGKVYVGDCREYLAALPEESVNCVVTSPPYWSLRKYAGEQEVVWPSTTADGCAHEWVNTPQSKPLEHGHCCYCGSWRGALGLEPVADCGAWTDVFRGEEIVPGATCHVCHILSIMRLVRRVLRKDGTCFLNYGDSYNSIGGTFGGGKSALPRSNERRQWEPTLKPKDLVLMPSRIALALQADGWWVRSWICWVKPNPMPESVTDRPASSHETILLLTKSASYYYDGVAVREVGSTGRMGVAGIVEPSDFPHKPIVFSDQCRTQHAIMARSDAPTSHAHPGVVLADGVRLATAILERSEFKGQLCLSALHAQVRQQAPDRGDSLGVGDTPADQRAGSLAMAFLNGEIPAKDFLEKCRHLGIVLANRDHLRVSGSASQPDSPGTNSDSDAAVRIDYTGQIGEYVFSCHDADTTTVGLTSSRATRNLRNVWQIATQPYPEAHFATFPEELARRCILAGCPPKVCADCGAPWRRVVERNTAMPRRHGDWKQTDNPQRNDVDRKGGFYDATSRTLGWEPTCKCTGETRPGIVLDPFLGSGTVAAVAEKLGHWWAGCEISAEYAALAEKRIATAVGGPVLPGLRNDPQPDLGPRLSLPSDGPIER